MWDPNKNYCNKNFNILLASLLMAISLLLIVSIYCYIKIYFIKEHLLPRCGTSNKLKEIYLNNRIKKKKKSKEIHIKTCTYYSLPFQWHDQYKKNDPNQIRIDKKPYKNILIYHITCVTVKVFSYATIISVNPVCPTTGKINRMYLKRKWI